MLQQVALANQQAHDGVVCYVCYDELMMLQQVALAYQQAHDGGVCYNEMMTVI